MHNAECAVDAVAELIIRPMMLDDADRKGYVHWKSCLETYTGLMDPDFLARSTLDKYRSIAAAYADTTLVAELDGVIVGFGTWSDDEISALYILREFHGLGIGRKLIDALLAQMPTCGKIRLQVLDGNDHAIGFYQHMGFRQTGEPEYTRFSRTHPAYWMTRKRT